MKQSFLKFKTESGLDVIEKDNFSSLKGCKVGILANPSSVNRHLIPITDLIYKNKAIELSAIFGPQHGLYGHTQDNMIEWEGFRHPRFNCPVYSLYGKVRKPKDSMLEGLDIIVIDLPGIGSRYYTFLWTAMLMLQACENKKIKVLVLDRPNPITGLYQEGPGLNKNFLSFVGLHPLIIRHGMTIGELLSLIHKELNLKTYMEIISMENWHRELWFYETGLPWVFPSPNMPTPDSSLVYPGGCLIEGTLLSEGRGTTKPFELIGAPYIEGDLLKKDLESFDLNGVIFRPVYFEPAFQKHAGKVCGGLQLHITDRHKFEPVKTFTALLLSIHRLYEKENLWRPPPYEYEYEKLPFDILSGSENLRKQIDRGESLEAIVDSWKQDLREFRKRSLPCLLYENRG